MTRSTGISGLILLRVAAERRHGVAHRGEVDHRRHAGEVLHQHARRAEGDLAVAACASSSQAATRADVVGGDGAAVLVAQQVLEQHLQREGQARDARQAVLLGRRQAVIVVGLAADREGAAGLEAVERGWSRQVLSSIEMASARGRPGSRRDRRDSARRRATARAAGLIVNFVRPVPDEGDAVVPAMPQTRLHCANDARRACSRRQAARMRLSGEGLAAERGGRPVFDGVVLRRRRRRAAGASPGRTAPASRRCSGSSPGCCAPAAGSGRARPGAEDGLAGVSALSRPSRRAEAVADGRARTSASGGRLSAASRRRSRRRSTRSASRHLVDLPAAVLSAGQRRRVALARLLVVAAAGLAPRRADDGARRRGRGDARRADRRRISRGGGLVIAATHRTLPVGAGRDAQARGAAMIGALARHRRPDRAALAPRRRRRAGRRWSSSSRVVIVVPFGVGPDLNLLSRIGPAILWIGALLATLLGLDRLFQDDRDDGSLDLLVAVRPAARARRCSPRRAATGSRPACRSSSPRRSSASSSASSRWRSAR